MIDPEASNIQDVFQDLGSATHVPPKWIVRDVLPVGLTVMGGAPKTANKSTFSLALACVVAGHKCLALPPHLSIPDAEGPVMIFSAEATPGELKHTIETGMGLKIPADESILVCDESMDWRLDDPDGMRRLEYWLDARRPKLAIIDPLRDFHFLEEKDSRDMIRILRPLQRWAKKAESAVVIVHHINKPTYDRSGQASSDADPNRLRGSGAIFGLADAILMLTGAQQGWLHVRATFKRAKGWEKTIRPAWWDSLGQPAIEKLDQADDLVLKAIKGGLRTIPAVKDHVKMHVVQVQNSVSKLVLAGLVTQAGNELRAMP